MHESLKSSRSVRASAERARRARATHKLRPTRGHSKNVAAKLWPLPFDSAEMALQFSTLYSTAVDWPNERKRMKVA